MSPLDRDAALRFVRARADVLDCASNSRNPFACSEWIQHFIEQVVGDDSRVLAIEADGGQSLMLLLRSTATPRRCAGLANYYSSLYSPMASVAEDRHQAMRSMVQRLTAARPRIGTVNFVPMDAQSHDTHSLREVLGQQGWYVRRYFAFGNWTLPCDGLGFEDYMLSRDSQVRNTFARKSRKLLASGEVNIFTEARDVERAMDAYDAIYARSWKTPEPYPEFVRGWARRCANRGWLRLGVASVEGVPIAAQFWFTVGRRAYIFKLAYDASHAKWSAGTVLTATLIRHAMEQDHVAEIDYLTGDDAYKSVWMTHRRERIGMMACNLRTPGGLIAAALERAGSATASLRARHRRSAPNSAAGNLMPQRDDPMS